MTTLLRATLLASSLTLLSTAADADGMGTIARVTGQALANEQPAAAGIALEADMRIETGPGALVVLQFEDQQTILLGENTRFILRDFAFDPQTNKGHSISELVSGSLRQVSGLVARDNPGRVKVSTPMATLGVRGADFMTATGSLYLSVSQGVVSATNAAGTVTFRAGQSGYIGSAWSVPSAIGDAQLPASVSSAFSQLGEVAVNAAILPAAEGTAVAGAGAVSVEGTGISASAIAIGAAVAGALAIISGGETSTTSHH